MLYVGRTFEKLLNIFHLFDRNENLFFLNEHVIKLIIK